MTDRLPGSVEGTVPSQWLLDEKVRRQRAEAESESLRAALRNIADHPIVEDATIPENSCDWHCTAEIVALARAALGEADGG